MVQLNPCRKCGNAPVITRTTGIPAGYSVKCPYCGDGGLVRSGSEEEAAGRWNAMCKTADTRFIG